MTGSMTASPINAVAAPTISVATMMANQIIIGSLFLSTALIDVMTAVTASTRRCMIIGNENALIENVNTANIAPTAEPIVR